MFGIVGLGLGQSFQKGVLSLHYKLRTTADQLISDYTRTKTMNKAEKLKNNREKAILEVTETEMDNFNN